MGGKERGGYCELRKYNLGMLSDSQWESLVNEPNDAFILTNATNSALAASYSEFIEKHGSLQLLPKGGLEIMVDGRMSKDDPNRPRPSVSIEQYLQHLKTQEQQKKDESTTFYGLLLTPEDIKTRNEITKKHAETSDGKGESHIVDLASYQSNYNQLQQYFNEQLMSFPGSSGGDTSMISINSESGSSTLPFQSHGVSWHLNMHGTSSWYLYEPIGVPHTVAEYFVLSDIDGEYLANLDTDIRPKICSLEPGEMLVVPKYWHYARSSDEGNVVFSRQEHHQPVKPNQIEGLEELEKESELFPEVHQLHVDIALKVVKSDPKQCLKRMEMAVEANPFNLALRWQVSRLLSKIGAKSDSLNLATKSVEILTKAFGIDTAGGENGGKTKISDNNEEEQGGDAEYHSTVVAPVISENIAKVHWLKFGQLLLFDLNMPLEAIMCFQMRLEMDPNDISTAMLKVRALTLLGGLDEAKVALKDVLEIDPNHEQASKMLSELDSDEARNLAETMKQMSGVRSTKFAKEALAAITGPDGRIRMPNVKSDGGSSGASKPKSKAKNQKDKNKKKKKKQA